MEGVQHHIFEIRYCLHSVEVYRRSSVTGNELHVCEPTTQMSGVVMVQQNFQNMNG